MDRFTLREGTTMPPKGTRNDEAAMDDSCAPSAEQVRELFAAYGLAMYQSQCLEREMAHFLAFEQQLPGSHRATLEDRLAEYYEATFGSLASLVAEVLGQSILATAIRQLISPRNDLAHSYFWTHAAPMLRTSGCNQMAADLHELARRFDEVDKSLSRLTVAHAARLGLTQQGVADAWADIVAGRGLPAPARPPKLVRLVSAHAWSPQSPDSTRIALVFVTQEGDKLVLGDRGLCYAPPDVRSGELRPFAYPARALPAEVRTRPPGALPRKYAIRLAGGFELFVEPHATQRVRFGFRHVI